MPLYKRIMEFIMIRHQGVIYRIAKQPFETDEQAHDRGWWLIKNGGSVNDSLKWMYEKYLRVKY
jgi:hypothetical protein